MHKDTSFNFVVSHSMDICGVMLKLDSARD